MALRNLITDVAGVLVGNAHDERLASGVTVALFERPAVASVFVSGGAPAARDLECLEPERTVERVDAIVLSGGSGFGLDSTTGVQAWLRERGRGLPVRGMRVPIAPTAILFDLLNGGDKDWGRYPPYRELGHAACEAASAGFRLGSEGAGYGATTVDLRGGLGSASARTSSGATVAALVAANSIGSAVIGAGPHFWAAPFERDGEFGGLGWPGRLDSAETTRLTWKGRPGAGQVTRGQVEPGTTIGLVATDAALTKAECKRLALMATGGLAKALRIAAAPADGDTIFAASTRRRDSDLGDDLTELGALASDCVARAVARGVYEARSYSSSTSLSAWRDVYSFSVA